MQTTSRANDFPAKITTLWTAFLLGLLFHTQLALMPLFHGNRVVQSHAHDYVSVNAILWFMLIFFCIPLVAIASCVFCSSRPFRQIHFGITLVYTGLNLLHFVIDAAISVPGYQLALMALLLLLGLLLNLVAYQWIQAYGRAKPLFSQSV